MAEKLQTITTRLPVRLIELLRQEKKASGRPLERIFADIISEKLAEDMEAV